MIEKFLHIDFEKKHISFVGKIPQKGFSIKELYSYLMDLFDEPEYMKYDLPIEAVSDNSFTLINNWTLDPTAKKHIHGQLESVK